jgi:hypothetical protein
MSHKFFPQQRTALGQPRSSSAGCPDFSPMRGVVWGVIFSSPFWLLGALMFLYFMK